MKVGTTDFPALSGTRRTLHSGLACPSYGVPPMSRKVALSVGVDELRVQLRKAKPARPAQRMFSEYLLTVQGDTDSASTRQRRREILKNLVWPIFDRKDPMRGFSVEQRRLLWHKDEAPKCARCGRRLSWDDFTIDHIKAWSRGGPTSALNAQLMHRRCNSAKGAR